MMKSVKTSNQAQDNPLLTLEERLAQNMHELLGPGKRQLAAAYKLIDKHLDLNKVIKSLKKNGTNINRRYLGEDGKPRNLLDWALEQNDSTLFTVLLKNGASPHQNQVLSYSDWDNDTRNKLGDFVDQSRDVYVPSYHKYEKSADPGNGIWEPYPKEHQADTTLLARVIDANHSPFLKILLPYKPEISPGVCIALVKAANNDHWDTVKIFFEETELPDKYDYIADYRDQVAQLAVEQERSDIVQLLLKKFLLPITSLYPLLKEQAQKGKSSVLKLIIELMQAEQLPSPNDFYDTCLHTAVLCNEHGLVGSLLDRIKNSKQLDALINLAIAKNALESAKHLLQFKLNILQVAFDKGIDKAAALYKVQGVGLSDELGIIRQNQASAISQLNDDIQRLTDIETCKTVQANMETFEQKDSLAGNILAACCTEKTVKAYHNGFTLRQITNTLLVACGTFYSNSDDSILNFESTVKHLEDLAAIDKTSVGAEPKAGKHLLTNFFSKTEKQNLSPSVILMQDVRKVFESFKPTSWVHRLASAER